LHLTTVPLDRTFHVSQILYCWTLLTCHDPCRLFRLLNLHSVSAESSCLSQNDSQSTCQNHIILFQPQPHKAISTDLKTFASHFARDTDILPRPLSRSPLHPQWLPPEIVPMIHTFPLSQRLAELAEHLNRAIREQQRYKQ
jgi:hypothetical protein